MTFITTILLILAVISLVGHFILVYLEGDSVAPTKAGRLLLAIILFGLSFMFSTANHSLTQAALLFASIVACNWKYERTLD